MIHQKVFPHTSMWDNTGDNPVDVILRHVPVHLRRTTCFNTLHGIVCWTLYVCPENPLRRHSPLYHRILQFFLCIKHSPYLDLVQIILPWSLMAIVDSKASGYVLISCRRNRYLHFILGIFRIQILRHSIVVLFLHHPLHFLPFLIAISKTRTS